MDFYYADLSGPCRSVMLTAKAVGVKLNKIEVSLSKKDHLKPDFVAINFQHCIPTIVDGDLKLWESHAICAYLVSKYGKEDSLCPKDPNVKAQIDRLLYLDFTFFNAMKAYGFPILILGQKPDPSKIAAIEENLATLDKFLEGHDYAVGNTITIADHCLISTVSTVEAAEIDITKHPNVVSWFERCKETIPGYQTENEVGVKKFGAALKAKLVALQA